MAMDNYQAFIISVLQEASTIAHNSFGKVVGTTKSEDNNQVLTQTDIEVGALIVSRVKERYPDYNIIDEEAGVIDNHSKFTWVIDPIDGTSNFANGVPTYGIMIGLLDAGVPIAGGIAIPFFKEVYVAIKGQGAFCNGKRIAVSKETKLLNALVAYGIDGHQENPQITKDEAALLGDIVLNIRNLRSSNSAFDQVLVARGQYGATLNRTSKIWDNVAQQIVIEEAGGVYTDFYGHPIDYSDPLNKVESNYTYCAASLVLHEQLMRLIHNPA
jgi:myo-inositol-1(or 4)-monophosphatase